MTRELQRDPESMISRRTLVQGLAIAAGATVVSASGALAQQGGELAPPSTITTPPRDFGPGGAPTTYFWDPDIIAVDPSFADLAQPNTATKRLYTGFLWAEGPTRPATSAPPGMAVTGPPPRRMAVSSTRASPTLRAAPVILPASSIHGSASRPASCRANANSRPTAIASIPAVALTSW